VNAPDKARLAAAAEGETASLRRCVRDLVALSTLPAAWMHSAPLAIVESLAEVVLRMLKLDLAYVRMPQARGGMLEAGRTRGSAATPGRGAELGRLLAERIGFGEAGNGRTIPDPQDGVPLHLVLTPIGHDRDCGWLAAASRRAGFPGADERLLLGVAANQLAMVLQRRSAEDLLREEAKSLEILNRTGEALAAELNLERVVQQVTDAATRLTGAQFGAFFYNVRNEAGESYQLYTISGVPREAFAGFPMPRNTAVFAPTFNGTAIVRSGDIRKDPRYGRSAPHHGLPEGHLPVVSYLAVPVVSRSKEVLGGLFFGHPEPGVFDERAERLAAGIAAQAAVAIDNARLYERLRDSASRLAEADRRKDEFLATLAHELRNPLAPLRNGLESLRLAGGNAQVADAARAMMQRQLEQLVRLVDDLLDMSRISTGKIELRREWSELGAIVHSALETIGPLMERSGQRFELELPPEPVYLDADPVRLAQVFGNLLNNAAKYTQRGGTIVLAAARRSREVEVAVRDNGIGIRADMLPRVFDLFTQADTSLEKAHGGLGIGLTIVRRLVELHGGSVQAKSEGPGRGSEFVVRLPLIEPGTPRKAAPAAAAPPARRILVVDDNLDAAQSLALLLQAMGSEAHTASDGPQALRLAEALSPEVILLDIGMPGMSGYDVCRAIRAQPWAGAATLIALSGWGQEEHRARARDAGFDHYFVKPVELEALRRLLAEARPGAA
jgi:signal transduction histidine kinase/ActR/RegA family two-component response regulator